MTESAGGCSALAGRGVLGTAVEWMGQVAVVTVWGELDLLTAPQLEEVIEAAVEREPATLIVDLLQVEFLASAGMDVLLGAHRRITPSARFGIVADGRATRRPLELLGLHHVLALYATVDDALSHEANDPQ